MLIRGAGLLRFIGAIIHWASETCYVAADIIEHSGANPDLDTVLWLLLLYCILARKFTWFFGAVALIVFGSPVWNTGWEPVGPAVL